MITAQEKLENKIKEQKFICVGLDADIKKIPGHLQSNTNPILAFNKLIIEATADLAAAYKFNLAFYETFGTKGLDILFESINMIPGDVMIIGDGKRGDIGNTSEKYAQMLYNEFNFDSATINPYMGKDSLDPFLNYKTKINFILTLTSNQGANDFEKLQLADKSFFYQEVIRKVKNWNLNDNCGLVFGATKSEELQQDIKLFDNMPILLPGIGAQGGSLEDVVKIFKANNKSRFVINVSRSVIYKSSGEDFPKLARTELENMNRTISNILNF